MKKTILPIIACLCAAIVLAVPAFAEVTVIEWLGDFDASIDNEILNINWGPNAGAPDNATVTIDPSVNYAKDATLKWAYNTSKEGWSQLNFMPDDLSIIGDGIMLWAMADKEPVDIDLTLMVNWKYAFSAHIKIGTVGREYTINWDDCKRYDKNLADVDLSKKVHWYIVMSYDGKYLPEGVGVFQTGNISSSSTMTDLESSLATSGAPEGPKNNMLLILLLLIFAVLIICGAVAFGYFFIFKKPAPTATSSDDLKKPEHDDQSK